MGRLIGALVLLIIGCLPVGVFFRYDSEGWASRLCLGPIRLKFPAGNEKKQDDKDDTQTPAEKKDRKASSGSHKPEKKSGGSLTDFLPLVQVALDFLGDSIHHLRIRNLQVKLVLAGDDPCDLAVNYGRAWAAVGNIMPVLENHLHTCKREVDVQCDFSAEETTISASATVTVTVGRGLYLVIRYGWRGLRQWMNLKNKRKGGAEK